MNHTHRTAPSMRRQAGFSLVELMIALGIGMVVMGAVFATYIAANQGNRHNRAITQMTEDATSALAVLRAHTAMAGYSVPVGFAANGQSFRLAFGGPYVNGCQGGTFTDTASGIDALACPAGNATSPDSLAVAYEASAGNLLDCLGNSVQAIAAAAGPPATPGYNLAYSRFYLNGTSLMCRGNPSTGAQPLAENVKDMQILYGIQGQPVQGVKQPVGFYTDAATVAAATPPLWNRVASLRICLVMQSEADNVVESATPYTGCFPANYGDQVTPADKRAYRAFTTTIALNNRLPVDPPPPAAPPP